jgi:hypothetical protein
VYQELRACWRRQKKQLQEQVRMGSESQQVLGSMELWRQLVLALAKCLINGLDSHREVRILPSAPYRQSGQLA